MSSHSFLPDLTITICSFLLLSLGILVIFSSDQQMAIQQLIFGFIGFGLFWFLSSIDYEYYQHWSKISYIIVLILLIIVLIIGIETRGSTRWIPIGPFNLQPSELAKPMLILTLATFWSKRVPTYLNIAKSILIFLPIFGLVFRQPDLGTALTLAFIWLIMLFGANISFFKLLLMGILSIIVIPLGWNFLKQYQKDRIMTFLNPTQDPLGVGYNVIQSMIAVGSGQVFGRGLGHGTQSRLQFLPEFRTDFIFASIAEELGLFGALVMFILYGIILIRSLRIAYICNNLFGTLLIFGSMGMFLFQMVVNVGMNMGILPITGITLPLISYGGSSLITTMICLGFIASVSRYKARRQEVGI